VFIEDTQYAFLTLHKSGDGTDLEKRIRSKSWLTFGRPAAVHQERREKLKLFNDLLIFSGGLSGAAGQD
jgi:hypothetical protein